MLSKLKADKSAASHLVQRSTQNLESCRTRIKSLRQMSQCITLSLENDIRRHASGSEKVVFAQRNPLAEMYPNAVFRDFEQEKMDECLEVSRQPSQPSAHIVFCRACASFMMSLGREPGSGSRLIAKSPITTSPATIQSGCHFC